MGQESNSTSQKSSSGSSQTSPQQLDAAKTILQQLELHSKYFWSGYTAVFLAERTLCGWDITFVSWSSISMGWETQFCQAEEHRFGSWESPGVTRTHLESRLCHLESPRVTCGDTRGQPGTPGSHLRSHQGSPGVTWSHPESPAETPGVTWSHPDSPRVTWSHWESPRVTRRVTWSHLRSLLESPRVTWSHQGSPGVT